MRKGLHRFMRSSTVLIYVVIFKLRWTRTRLCLGSQINSCSFWSTLQKLQIRCFLRPTDDNSQPLKDLITVFAHPCRFRLEALRWKSLWWYFFSDNLQNSCYTINCGMISYNRSTLHGDVGMISFSHSVSWYIPRDILHSLVARWGWDVVIQFTLFPDTLLLTTFACIKLFRLWTQPV